MGKRGPVTCLTMVVSFRLFFKTVTTGHIWPASFLTKHHLALTHWIPAAKLSHLPFPGILCLWNQSLDPLLFASQNVKAFNKQSLPDGQMSRAPL